MNCLYQFLLTLLLLLGTASSASGLQDSSLSAPDFEQFRQTLQLRLSRMQTGLNRLDEKIRSLSSQKEASDDDQKSLADFQRKKTRLQFELTLLERMDQSVQIWQESQAAGRPSESTVPEFVQDYTARGSLSLPTGGPKNPSGFTRACPAETQPENPDLWSGSEALSLPEEGNGSLNSGLKMPASGTISAGTWAYPSGALHLGMDLALPMYTPVRAPADGVILYAASITGDAGGYLGNWIGWPYGGGNTIAMICRSGSRLYGVTFCHLSSRIMIRPGQKVRQGDLLAYSGNTGNSTGPHTHIELFELRVSFEEAVQYFQQAADFSFGTGWSAPAVCSSVACQRRPELYFK